jgi:hypothetical protein
MATLFVFPSFGAAVGAPADPAVDDASGAEREAPVAVDPHGEDDAAA